MTDQLSAETRERFYKAIIGESNQAYYLSYFERADARGYAPVSWHWPVLFFGVLWFLYRRMYRWAIGALVLPYLLAIVTAPLETSFPGTGRPVFLTVIVSFYAVWLPLVANGLYYRQGQRMIRVARLLQAGDERAQYDLIRMRGGVHAKPLLIALGALMLAAALIGNLATPS